MHFITSGRSIFYPLFCLFVLVSSHPARQSPVASSRFTAAGPLRGPTAEQLAIGLPTHHQHDEWAAGLPSHHDHEKFSSSLSGYNDFYKGLPARPREFMLIAGDDAPSYIRGKVLRVDSSTNFIRLDAGRPIRAHFAHGNTQGRVLVTNMLGRELAGIPSFDPRFYNTGYELKVTAAALEKRHDMISEWALASFKKRLFCITGENDHVWYGGNCERTGHFGGSPRFSLKIEYF